MLVGSCALETLFWQSVDGIPTMEPHKQPIAEQDEAHQPSLDALFQ